MHDNVLNNDVGHWQLEKDKMLGQLGEKKIIVYCNHGGFRLCLVAVIIYRGYYTVARRYEFYFRVAKQYFTNERSE